MSFFRPQRLLYEMGPPEGMAASMSEDREATEGDMDARPTSDTVETEVEAARDQISALMADLGNPDHPQYGQIDETVRNELVAQLDQEITDLENVLLRGGDLDKELQEAEVALQQIQTGLEDELQALVSLASLDDDSEPSTEGTEVSVDSVNYTVVPGDNMFKILNTLLDDDAVHDRVAAKYNVSADLQGEAFTRALWAAKPDLKQNLIHPQNEVKVLPDGGIQLLQGDAPYRPGQPEDGSEAVDDGASTGNAGGEQPAGEPAPAAAAPVAAPAPMAEPGPTSGANDAPTAAPEPMAEANANGNEAANDATDGKATDTHTVDAVDPAASTDGKDTSELDAALEADLEDGESLEDAPAVGMDRAATLTQIEGLSERWKTGELVFNYVDSKGQDHPVRMAKGVATIEMPNGELHTYDLHFGDYNNYSKVWHTTPDFYVRDHPPTSDDVNGLTTRFTGDSGLWYHHKEDTGRGLTHTSYAIGMTPDKLMALVEGLVSGQPPQLTVEAPPQGLARGRKKLAYELVDQPLTITTASVDGDASREAINDDHYQEETVPGQLNKDYSSITHVENGEHYELIFPKGDGPERRRSVTLRVNGESVDVRRVKNKKDGTVEVKYRAPGHDRPGTIEMTLPTGENPPTDIDMDVDYKGEFNPDVTLDTAGSSFLEANHINEAALRRATAAANLSLNLEKRYNGLLLTVEQPNGKTTDKTYYGQEQIPAVLDALLAGNPLPEPAKIIPTELEDEADAPAGEPVEEPALEAEAGEVEPVAEAGPTALEAGKPANLEGAEAPDVVARKMEAMALITVATPEAQDLMDEWAISVEGDALLIGDNRFTFDGADQLNFRTNAAGELVIAETSSFYSEPLIYSGNSAESLIDSIYYVSYQLNEHSGTITDAEVRDLAALEAKYPEREWPPLPHSIDTVDTQGLAEAAEADPSQTGGAEIMAALESVDWESSEFKGRVISKFIEADEADSDPKNLSEFTEFYMDLIEEEIGLAELSPEAQAEWARLEDFVGRLAHEIEDVMDSFGALPDGEQEAVMELLVGHFGNVTDPDSLLAVAQSFLEELKTRPALAAFTTELDDLSPLIEEGTALMQTWDDADASAARDYEGSGGAVDKDDV